jgi:hypothetical protein
VSWDHKKLVFVYFCLPLTESFSSTEYNITKVSHIHSCITHVCVCVCVCVHIYMCMYMHIYMYIYAGNIYTYVYI